MPRTSEQNRDTVRAYRERQREQDPTWAARQSAASCAYAKKRRKNDPEWVATLKARKLAHKTAFPVEHKIKEVLESAKQRGWTFTLPALLIRDLVTDNCFYCGAAPAPVNGIDRVDSAHGYEGDNVVTACRSCNVAKTNHSLGEFAAWVKRAATHQERYSIA